MQVDILQLFSQWAISTGEEGPKNFWGYFFYFYLKLWKVLTKPQRSINKFLPNKSFKKKVVSFIESNTGNDVSSKTMLCWLFETNLQLSKSSRAFFWGAYFSAVSGWKSIPISVPGPYKCPECNRLLGFCLTITFCLNPAHQAVSNWNCHWNWRISHLGDHKYLPFVTNPYK